MGSLLTRVVAFFATFSWSTLTFGLTLASAGVWLKEKMLILGGIVAALGIGAGILMWHDSTIRTEATADANAAWTLKFTEQEKSLREKYERQNEVSTKALEETLTAIEAKADDAAKLNDTLTSKLKAEEANKPSVVCWPAAIVTRKYGRRKR